MFPLAPLNPMPADRHLIFDIGGNHGEDSRFYLDKGFRVVCVEADPLLAEELRQGFHAEIASGQIIVEGVGLMASAGTLPFYRNIDCDHWSSFDATYGCRQGTKYEVIDVDCITFAELIGRHGCPYYMKVDIEGADQLVLTQMKSLWERPQFVSIEEYGATAFDDLAMLGYTMFSLRTQLDKSWAVPPQPAREGNYVDRIFTQRDTGLFGLEVPDWMSLDEARQEFAVKVRSKTGEWLPGPGEWYDIHATYWPTAIDDTAFASLIHNLPHGAKRSRW